MIILHFHLQPQFKNELFHICFTSKLLPLLGFFSMQIFRTWENCTLADIKNSFYLLKIKQSAQSHLTSCEIRGDVEGYFCWRRKQRVFEKTATRCSSFNFGWAHWNLKYWNFCFSFAFIFSLAIFPYLQYINL